MAKYDLAIIGSGPGGYNTAIRAAQWGLKTVVVEKDGFLGGTCLHVGCIPAKVFLHHAEIYDTFKNAKEFGIDVKEFTLNWPAVLARKEKIVNKHAKGIEFLLRTQIEDGSWFVESRAVPIQAAFASGFPYGPHQWVSAAATGWAVTALALSK